MENPFLRFLGAGTTSLFTTFSPHSLTYTQSHITDGHTCDTGLHWQVFVRQGKMVIGQC